MKCNHLVLYGALLFQEGIQLFLHDFLKEKDEESLVRLQLSSRPATYHRLYIQVKHMQATSKGSHDNEILPKLSF